MHSALTPGLTRDHAARLAFAGATSLLLGVWLYAQGRGLLARSAPGWPVVVAGCLPSFLHAFSFTLWTLLALGPTRARAVATVAGAWAVLECGIEVFQHPLLHARLPAGIAAHWAGTFDLWDMAAAGLGTVVASVLYLRHKHLNH